MQKPGAPPNQTLFLILNIMDGGMEERTNLPENNNEGRNSVQKDHRSEDLAIISRWVKSEVFDTVKFLYKPEKDLAIKGQLYNKYIQDCRQRLIGLKVEGSENQAYRWMYVNSLWNEATRKGNNLIANDLSSRRSAVYSAMQNRFIGKFNGSDDAI